MVFLPALCFAIDCTVQERSKDTESIKLYFYGSSFELAKIETLGTRPDQYFILNAFKDDRLYEEYVEIAVRKSEKLPLEAVKKPSTLIYVKHVKGGNQYSLKRGNQEFKLVCR